MLSKLNEDSFVYEKVFVTGRLGLSLLNQAKGDEKDEDGKKFKIIVDRGELYLECIDSFEEIFELNKEMVENVELTSILEPGLFDNHRDIINALFQVYYEMGEEYLKKYWDDNSLSPIKEAARERVEKKYSIGKYSGAELGTLKERDA